MMMFMGTLHISAADLARDPFAVLAKVEEGVEVIVERNHRPVATIRTPKRAKKTGLQPEDL
jgi:antitoxin (DNA-binding transcriptional repressor) of toxin-antitoxin stability system